MSHLSSRFGIAAELNQRRLTIFDTDDYGILHQFELDLDFHDVIITPDSTGAVATAFVSKNLVQIDLSSEPPIVVHTEEVAKYVEDVSITPDGQFALTVDGSITDAYLYVYDLINNAVSSQTLMNAQAIAVSPNGNGLVMVAKFNNSKVHCYTVDAAGNLSDNGQEISSGGDGPINISFSPDGHFAFVVNFRGNNLGILKVLPGMDVELFSTITTNLYPQTVVVSKDGKSIYVLTAEYVDVFGFDPATGTISSLFSFAHGMNRGAGGYYGVDQMDLDSSDSKLFIAANGFIGASPQLKVFALDGTFLGEVSGVLADAGVCTRPPIGLSRGIDFRIFKQG